MLTVTFDMNEPEPKKGSVRFNFEKIVSCTDDGADLSSTDPVLAKDLASKLKACSFYIPRPVAQDSKRIRVTIEEL